jgi:carbon storage regulator
MLVLSRKLGESLVIDGRIRVTITSIGEARVKIGIEAHPDIPVHRSEVHDKLNPPDDR